MIKVIYAPDGEVVADAGINQWTENFLVRAPKHEENFRKKEEKGELGEEDTPDFIVRVGCELMILSIVYKMWAGQINYEQIDFYMDGHEEPLRKVERNGRWLVKQEPGWCEYYDTLLNKLIGAY